MRVPDISQGLAFLRKTCAVSDKRMGICMNRTDILPHSFEIFGRIILKFLLTR